MTDELTLREYQSSGVDFLVEHGRAILGDEMGLGKTCQAVLAAKKLMRPNQKCLIVCPKPAIGVWEREIKVWTGDSCIKYAGTLPQRTKSWKQFSSVDWCITNFAHLRDLPKKSWRIIIIDEAHHLKNPKVGPFITLDKEYYSKYLLLLSGSPVKNGAQDLWTLLHLVDPIAFPKYWGFVMKYLVTLKDERLGYTEITGAVKHPLAFQQLLRKYMIRRLKKDHLKELPAKTRMQIPIQHSAKQRKLYDTLADEMMLELPNGNLLLTPNTMTKILRLRQLNVSPKLLGFPEKGTMIDAFLEDMEDEFHVGPILVFTPFAKLLPGLRDILAEKGVASAIIQGGMAESKITAIVTAFQNGTHKRQALLCSVLSGQSWTATRASVAYFLGYDWVPANCHQAEDRIHRFGQTRGVRIKYFTCEDTVDEHVLSVLSQKTTWATLALEPTKLLRPNTRVPRMRKLGSRS